MTPYPTEVLPDDGWDSYTDNGTMPANVDELAKAVVGHRIVSVEPETISGRWHTYAKLVITLDNGHRVSLVDTEDCCAYTVLKDFLLDPAAVDHVITGVGTTDKYETWHIYADMGDVLRLNVEWSAGNPFYYGYGFEITVEPIEDART